VSLTGPAPQEAIHHRATGRDRVISVIKHILLIAASVIMIYPLLWLVASSLRPTEVIFRTPGLWLNDLYVENYTKG
jgi:multiple sugar transport system permease protein